MDREFVMRRDTLFCVVPGRLRIVSKIPGLEATGSTMAAVSGRGGATDPAPGSTMAAVVGHGGATDPAPGVSIGRSAGSETDCDGPATGSGVAVATPGKTDLMRSRSSLKSRLNSAVASSAAVARRLAGAASCARDLAFCRADCLAGAMLQQ